MGINNIDDLKGNASVDASEPTAPPQESNTQAGTPATPIDNVAKEQADAAASPEDSATGDESSDE